MKSVPKGIRALIDYFVIFKPKGLIELEGYTDEIFGVSKREMKDIMEFVYDGDHNFLLYNNKNFYKNFDKFTIAST